MVVVRFGVARLPPNLIAITSTPPVQQGALFRRGPKGPSDERPSQQERLRSSEACHFGHTL